MIKSLLPYTVSKVSKHTSNSINNKIRANTLTNIERFKDKDFKVISRRIEELKLTSNLSTEYCIRKIKSDLWQTALYM